MFSGKKAAETKLVLHRGVLYDSNIAAQSSDDLRILKKGVM
jgi:hypothetical protein